MCTGGIGVSISRELKILLAGMVHASLSAALVASLLLPGCLSASPPIKVSMQTSWNSPSKLLELMYVVSSIYLMSIEAKVQRDNSHK